MTRVLILPFTLILVVAEVPLKCNVPGHSLLEAKFGKETHSLCLKLVDIGSSPITNRRITVLLDPEGEALTSGNSIELHHVMMAYGFPAADPASGSAEGYIGDDQQFYGVLHLHNRTLHADPRGLDDRSRDFGVFDNDYMQPPTRPRRDYAQMDIPFGTHFPFRVEERSYVPGVSRARVCDLLLLADKEFFEKDANASLSHVVRRMVHAVGQADLIFRNADFNEDRVPDNIGFSVKYILVLTSTETNARVFGDLLNSKVIDGRQYLMRFARLRRLSEVCLGVAFSGHAFYNRTLGLSFTSLGGGLGGAAGGLCDRRAYGRSFNNLAISHATAEDKARVPERIAALTLAHEMGHSFGAHHDDNFPNPECRGYLMGSQSSTQETSKHFEFSLCSKRLIAATLHSMSYCLTEEDRPYCGNGIVENGEACDCGLPSRCSQKDPCCTPRTGGAFVVEEGTLHREGCLVAAKATCHPSQGACCLSTCQYADLKHLGIDCTTQDLECTCTDNTLDCKCAFDGRCMSDGTCHAVECASIGMRECQCIPQGIGGKVVEMKKCGICCLLEMFGSGGESECVSAELAAANVINFGGTLPADWPLLDYTGPNVTVNVCRLNHCQKATMRSWAIGQPCISRGVVGHCEDTGICKANITWPRSNTYPDIMNIQMAARFDSAKKHYTGFPLFFPIFAIICVVN